MPQDVDVPTCAPFTQVINEAQVGSLGSAMLVVLLLVYEAHGPDGLRGITQVTVPETYPPVSSTLAAGSSWVLQKHRDVLSSQPK